MSQFKNILRECNFGTKSVEKIVCNRKLLANQFKSFEVRQVKHERADGSGLQAMTPPPDSPLVLTELSAIPVLKFEV